MSIYPRLPFYAQMFADAGYPEAKELSGWSDGMVDAVVLWGDAETVRQKVRGLVDYGVSQVIAHPIIVGDAEASWNAALDALAGVARS